MQETIKSGLARVCTFDRKTASANVKVGIEDRRSPGSVIRRATDRSLTFVNLKHRKGVEYGRHLRGLSAVEFVGGSLRVAFSTFPDCNIVELVSDASRVRAAGLAPSAGGSCIIQRKGAED